MSRLTNDDKAFIHTLLTAQRATAEANVQACENLADIKEAVRQLDAIETIIAKVAPAQTNAS